MVYLQYLSFSKSSKLALITWICWTSLNLVAIYFLDISGSIIWSALWMKRMQSNWQYKLISLGTCPSGIINGYCCKKTPTKISSLKNIKEFGPLRTTIIVGIVGVPYIIGDCTDQQFQPMGCQIFSSKIDKVFTTSETTMYTLVDLFSTDVPVIS